MTATSARTYLSNLPTVTQLSGLETVGNFLRSFLLSLPGRDPNKYIWEKMFWWSPDILVSKLGWEDREPLRWQISAEVFIMWSVDCISPYIIQTFTETKIYIASALSISTWNKHVPFILLKVSIIYSLILSHNN